MVVQCKKVNYFVTGEVFLLDIGLLMGGLLMGAIGNSTLSLEFSATYKQ